MHVKKTICNEKHIYESQTMHANMRNLNKNIYQKYAIVNW